MPPRQVFRGNAPASKLRPSSALEIAAEHSGLSAPTHNPRFEPNRPPPRGAALPATRGPHPQTGMPTKLYIALPEEPRATHSRNNGANSLRRQTLDRLAPAEPKPKPFLPAARR